MAVTTAKEMRRKREIGIEFTLPEYGDVVFVKPIDALLYFRSGRVPDFLAATVQTVLGGTGWKMPDPDKEKLTEFWQFVDDLVMETIVSPKVVKQPREDQNEIGIDELGPADKLAIYYLFGRPAQLLRSFSKQPEKPLASVDAAKNDGHSAKRSVERPAVGQ